MTTAIPGYIGDDTSAADALESIKASLDLMGGQIKNAPRLAALDPSIATLADVIALVNEMLRRMQS